MGKKSPQSFENTVNIFGEISKNISWLSLPLLSVIKTSSQKLGVNLDTPIFFFCHINQILF